MLCWVVVIGAISAMNCKESRESNATPDTAPAAAIGTGSATPNPSSAPSAGASSVPSGTTSSPCPEDMLLVSGKYCPEVRHNCKRWIDAPGPFHEFRCAEYGPSTCTSKVREPLRLCIDRDEYTPKGEKMPAVHHSWTTAKSTCESLGKRLCLESEWQFACEGEEMLPYPYGYRRDATTCNIDRDNLGGANEKLNDLRAPSGAHPKCVSPFGVRNMSGNVEEWATQDHPVKKDDRSTMKGSWWLPGRNHCRARTVGHGEAYEGKQVGIRCCKDVS